MKYEKKMCFQGHSFSVLSFVRHLNFDSLGVNQESSADKENDFNDDEEENKLNDLHMIEAQEYEPAK